MLDQIIVDKLELLETQSKTYQHILKTLFSEEFKLDDEYRYYYCNSFRYGLLYSFNREFIYKLDLEEIFQIKNYLNNKTETIELNRLLCYKCFPYEDFIIYIDKNLKSCMIIEKEVII
jgi:hypothetical protein